MRTGLVPIGATHVTGYGPGLEMRNGSTNRLAPARPRPHGSAVVVNEWKGTARGMRGGREGGGGALSARGGGGGCGSGVPGTGVAFLSLFAGRGWVPGSARRGGRTGV